MNLEDGNKRFHSIKTSIIFCPLNFCQFQKLSLEFQKKNKKRLKCICCMNIGDIFVLVRIANIHHTHTHIDCVSFVSLKLQFVLCKWKDRQQWTSGKSLVGIFAVFLFRRLLLLLLTITNFFFCISFVSFRFVAYV